MLCSFKTDGPGTVHLTGNIIQDEPEMMDFGEEEEEEDSDSEEVRELLILLFAP